MGYENYFQISKGLVSKRKIGHIQHDIKETIEKEASGWESQGEGFLFRSELPSS